MARQGGPWGAPHTYPHHARPGGGNGEIFWRGAAAAGIRARVGPVAIPNGRFGHRSHCIYRGFCLQGCKVNAKASPLITQVPDALAHGAEIRADCMVSKVVLDTAGRACGVRYFRGGVERFQRARMVAVAGYSIETPRLLLLSGERRHPEGLLNNCGQVGRYLVQPLDLILVRVQLLFREPAHRLHDQLLFVGEREVHYRSLAFRCPGIPMARPT